MITGEPEPLVVDGGVTIDVDTQTVRALGRSVDQAHHDIADADASLAKAVMMAGPQLWASIPASPDTGLLVSHVLTGLAFPEGVGRAVFELGRECARVASAYDEVEGRLVSRTLSGVGYKAAVLAISELFQVRPTVSPARQGAVQELAPRPAPRNLADVAGWFEGYQQSEPGGGGRVDVIERTFVADDGQLRTSYAVVLPGTSSLALPMMDPSNEHVRTISANLKLAVGDVTPEMLALPEVLARAGVPAGAEVTLIGHSQGGMTALAVAGAPAMQAAYRVGHVITFGSPVGRMKIPKDVAVLSVENRSDGVPLLDLSANQASGAHVTVKVGAPPEGMPGTGEHGMDHYQKAAEQIDGSTHPSLVDFTAKLRQAGVLATDADGAGGRVQVRRIELTSGARP